MFKSRLHLMSSLVAVLLAGWGAGCGAGTKTPSLFILTTSLPDDTIGLPYSVTVQATGGTAPFAWSVSAGALPDNLTLASSSSSSVTISGTPDRVQAAVSFTIRVTDATNQTATQPYTVISPALRPWS